MEASSVQKVTKLKIEDKRFISKSELADYYGVCPKTISRYINKFYEDLQSLGYRHTQRFLTVRQYERVRDLLG